MIKKFLTMILVMLFFTTLSVSTVMAYEYPKEFIITKGGDKVTETIVDFTEEYGLPALTLVKDILNNRLVFTITLPKEEPYLETDVILLCLDYDDDGNTDAWVTWDGNVGWNYLSIPSGVPGFPPWVSNDRDNNVFTVSISLDESPINSWYRFYFLASLSDTDPTYDLFIGIPDFLLSELDSTDYEREQLPSISVIPETPLGTMSIIITMLGALSLYKIRT